MKGRKKTTDQRAKKAVVALDRCKEPSMGGFCCGLMIGAGHVDHLPTGWRGH